MKETPSRPVTVPSYKHLTGWDLWLMIVGLVTLAVGMTGVPPYSWRGWVLTAAFVCFGLALIDLSRELRG